MFRGGALGVMERWKPDCTSALVLGEIMSKNIFYEKICYVMNSWRYDLIPGFARTPLVTAEKRAGISNHVKKRVLESCSNIFFTLVKSRSSNLLDHHTKMIKKGSLCLE